MTCKCTTGDALFASDLGAVARALAVWPTHGTTELVGLSSPSGCRKRCPDWAVSDCERSLVDAHDLALDVADAASRALALALGAESLSRADFLRLTALPKLAALSTETRDALVLATLRDLRSLVCVPSCVCVCV